MFTKRKYQIWKHLTKSLVADGAMRQKMQNCLNQEWGSKSLHAQEGKEPARIICVQGYTYTGSSALIGFLNEFDNVLVIGNPENQWSGKHVAAPSSECRFFTHSHVMDLLEAYRNGKREEQDICIKKFINSVNIAYERKHIWEWEYLPELYGEKFRRASHRLLMRLLEMDAYTSAYMQEQKFPHTLSDDKYDHCSFVMGESGSKYIFYQFRELSEEEFNAIIADFLGEFFAIIGGREIVAYDWLLPGDYLEKINAYMKQPVKQVCVVRDPRDRYISALKAGCFLPTDADEYCTAYLKDIAASKPYEHRLVIRFEDLVCKYAETTSRVMRFLGLEPEHHSMPKSIFDPSISIANIGAWRSYIGKTFMNCLKVKMNQFCYDDVSLASREVCPNIY